MRYLAILFTILTLSAQAYTYPAGIPAAWIEPDVAAPGRPADWSSEVPGYYFVSWTTGTDSGRTWGTPAAPRKTIPAILAAGTRCEVSGSSAQVSGGILAIKGDGDSGSWAANTSGPAWIVSDPASPGSLQYRFIIWGSYFCVDGLNNLAGTTYWQISSINPATSYYADHILVRNCEIDGQHVVNSTLFPINTSSFDEANDIIVYNNEVHRSGPDTTPAGDLDYVGIFPGNGAQDIWILDNLCHDLAGGGIAVATQTSGTPLTGTVYIGRNEVYGTWGVGVSTKTAEKVVFSENHVHDIQYTTWTAQKGIGAQYNIQELWVLFNTVHGVDFGFKCGSTETGQVEKFYVIGNLFYDCHQDAADATDWSTNSYGPAAISLWGGDEKHILNNTIVDCDRGIGIPGTEGLTYGAVIQNNIFSDVVYQDIFVNDSPSVALIKNNIFSRSGTPEIRLTNTSYSPATLNSGFAGASGNIDGDPLFVGGGNYALQPGSPSIDAGISAASLPIDVYTLSVTNYSLNITKDILGNNRPSGAAWDIGAYEYGATGGGSGTITIDILNLGALNIGP